MKKVFLIICSAALASGSSAADRRIATPEEATEFLRNTTYVVNSRDNIVLDALLLDAVGRTWKATPYRVVDNTAFVAQRTDPKNSFLLITKVLGNKDKVERNFLFVNLLLGNAKAERNINVMPELGFMPLSGDVTQLNEFLLEPLLLFLQQNAENIRNKMFEKRLLFSGEDRMRAYNKNLEQLKPHKLYVAYNQIGSDVDTTKFAEQFGTNLVVVPSFDELAEVSKKDGTAAIAVSIYIDGVTSNTIAYKLVLGLDGTLYYYYNETSAKKFKFHSGDFDMWMRAYHVGN
jgi:hypothetical protein